MKPCRPRVGLFRMKAPLLLVSARFALLLAAPVVAADPAVSAPGEPEVNYVFNAKVVRVIDGGTVAMDVDLGFHMWLHGQVFRLQGVTAPAVDGPDKPAALAAKTRAQELLHADDEVILQSIRDKTDKSGAYHAVLWKDGENINEKLIRAAKP